MKTLQELINEWLLEYKLKAEAISVHTDHNRTDEMGDRYTMTIECLLFSADDKKLSGDVD